MPDRSGFPEAVFGAGPDMLGLPSGPLGTELGMLRHCALSGPAVNSTITAIERRKDDTISLRSGTVVSRHARKRGCLFSASRAPPVPAAARGNPAGSSGFPRAVRPAV